METLGQRLFLIVFFRIIGVLCVAAGTYFAVGLLKRIIDKKSRINSDSWTPLKFYSRLLYGVVYFFGGILCIYIVPPLRDLSFSLFAGSGILAIIIGFAAQASLANMVSGSFIAIFKPFRVGDRVRLIGRDVAGVIEDITLRHTVIRTFENKRVIVPNSVISTDLIENSNIIEEKTCRFFEIGISYDSDIDKAIKIIKEEAQRHPDFFDNRTDEEKVKGADPVRVKVLGFSDFSVIIRAWVWAKDNPTGFGMACDLNKTVKERFDAEGIEIPFPYRTLVFKEKTGFIKNTGT